MPFLDARIPLIFGRLEEAEAEDAFLLEGEGEVAPGRDWFVAKGAAAHPAGCACCAPRNGAGMALTRLMLARGRGDGPFFRRVVAVVMTEAGREAVRLALQRDPMASACFREG